MYVFGIDLGWNQQETLVHLAEKAGTRVRTIHDLVNLSVSRYESMKGVLTYSEYIQNRSPKSDKKATSVHTTGSLSGRDS